MKKVKEARSVKGGVVELHEDNGNHIVTCTGSGIKQEFSASAFERWDDPEQAAKNAAENAYGMLALETPIPEGEKRWKFKKQNTGTGSEE